MFAFAISLVLLASAASAQSLIEVEGKCEDVKPQPGYIQKKLIRKPWRIVQSSRAQAGDRCMSLTFTKAAAKDVFVNITVYNSESMKFTTNVNKYTHRGDGSYLAADGETVDTVVYTDYKNYIVCIKCKPVGGKAQVMLAYSTLSGKINKEAQVIFQKANKEFADMKLAVSIKDIPQEDCGT